MNAPVPTLLGTQELAAIQAWAARGWAAPSPHFIKHQVLPRNGWPAATWVETGTFMGQTTAVLAAHSAQVVSIEPEPQLFAQAQAKFSGQPHVHIINGVSEQVFPRLLPMLEGAVNLWLDGHYSAGITYKGPLDTPIREELAVISAQLARWPRVCVCVDDLRCFQSDERVYSEYPPLAWLVQWAEDHGLAWHIEHDIFVARRGA